VRIREFFGYQIAREYPLQLFIPTLSVEYRWNRNWRTHLAYRPIYFHGKTRTLWYSRWEMRVAFYKRKKRHRWRYALTAERFQPKTKKYQYRFVVSARWYDRQRLPWKGKLYLEHRLYYYYGGKPLKYYHRDGTWVVTRAPNDFHRYRFIIGARFRPYKSLRWSAYYFFQREFNNPFSNHRDIHVPSRDGTTIRYPFNNYSVLGLSLTVKLDLRKKKIKK